MYQQLPQNSHIDVAWRVMAGWLYLLKQILGLRLSLIAELLDLRKHKNVYKLQECLIIGNGPGSISLTEFQYNSLKKSGLKTFVLNNFWNSPLSQFITPDFIVISDPSYSDLTSADSHGLRRYIEANPEIRIISPTNGQRYLSKTLRINGISASGLWRGFSPLLPSTTVQGVLFDALKVSAYFGFSRIYVTGVEHSHYLNHKHLGAGKIFLDLHNLHSYDEKGIMPVIPHLTRNMADIAYAQAILLRDLRLFTKKVEIINVNLLDMTNDAFPTACLLPRNLRI